MSANCRVVSQVFRTRRGLPPAERAEFSEQTWHTPRAAWVVTRCFDG